jgi:hypothetical protein
MHTQRVLLAELLINQETPIERHAELPSTEMVKKTVVLKDRLDTCSIPDFAGPIPNALPTAGESRCTSYVRSWVLQFRTRKSHAGSTMAGGVTNRLWSVDE